MLSLQQLVKDSLNLPMISETSIPHTLILYICLSLWFSGLQFALRLQFMDEAKKSC